MGGHAVPCKRTWLLALAAFGLLLAQVLAPQALAQEPSRPAERFQYAGLVTQRPDPRGCLLAATATVANLLRESSDPALSYQDVWRTYDAVVPGFARDIWSYPQPWGLGPLADRLELDVHAVRGYSPRQIDDWLAQGLHPIVYLDRGPLIASHAVVILEHYGDTVYYFDPWDGTHAMPAAVFFRTLTPWASLLVPRHGVDPQTEDRWPVAAASSS